VKNKVNHKITEEKNRL